MLLDQENKKIQLKNSIFRHHNGPVHLIEDHGIQHAVFRKPVPSRKDDFEQVVTKKTVIKTMQTKDGKVISQHEEVKHN